MFLLTSLNSVTLVDPMFLCLFFLSAFFLWNADRSVPLVNINIRACCSQGWIAGWTWRGSTLMKRSRERSTWVWSYWRTQRRSAYGVESSRPGNTTKLDILHLDLLSDLSSMILSMWITCVFVCFWHSSCKFALFKHTGNQQHADNTV